jgi:TatD DNase family protein
MGKNKTPAESNLILPAATEADGAGSSGVSQLPIVDTHTHLHSTYSTYKRKYPNGTFSSIHEFVKGVYGGRNVEAIVDVWCETPVQELWKEIADSAVSEEGRAGDWGGLEYYFVMGEFLIGWV